MSERILQRVLLCRPHGGLNDTLCRISECMRYAARFGRHLVIDTRRCSLAAPLDRYFEFASAPCRLDPRMTPELSDHLDGMLCRPACLRGRIGTAVAVSAAGCPNMVDSATGELLQFAQTETEGFERDYDEPLLVYEGHGGGTSSAALLAHLRLATDVRERVRTLLDHLTPPYSAIHVRNTDLRTDYRRLLGHVARLRIPGPMLVCSDDPRVIRCARRTLPNPVLAFEGRSPSLNRIGTLHHPHSHTSLQASQRAAVDAIADLLALGNARQLFCGGTMSGRMSGFSLLASHLCRNKGVIDAMNGVPDSQRRPSDPAAVVALDLDGGWRHRLWQLRRALSHALRRSTPG